ncbi:hypothetical protein RRG08_063501 [Elysia crispata]|uniref:Histone H1 n=1 Tax=Elysia crispata TaxID=231223 RepID=A0AAE1B657_9GAST|nr:hypothetical protein RRG08_063501 [Elysia crispata]
MPFLKRAAPAATPAKPALKTKRAGKPKTRASHPQYKVIIAAITALKEHGGFILPDHSQVLQDQLQDRQQGRRLTKALKALKDLKDLKDGVISGQLKRTKETPAAKMRTHSHIKKPAVKKPATKKPIATKKPATKKPVATKKPATSAKKA